MSAKYPSFKAIYARKPVAGKDYDRNATMCQDDYEFFTGTGRYSDQVRKCECGRTVKLVAFTNHCDCGRDYNLDGDKLAPRRQWGEETGESAGEIMTGDVPGGQEA